MEQTGSQTIGKRVSCFSEEFASMTAQTARLDLAWHTRCGIAHILVGVLLWLVFGVLGLTLSDSPRNGLIYLFGAGLLWPLGLTIGAALKLDLFASDNPLTSLAGLLFA